MCIFWPDCICCIFSSWSTSDMTWLVAWLYHYTSTALCEHVTELLSSTDRIRADNSSRRHGQDHLSLGLSATFIQDSAAQSGPHSLSPWYLMIKVICRASGGHGAGHMSQLFSIRDTGLIKTEVIFESVYMHLNIWNQDMTNTTTVSGFLLEFCR